MDASEVTVMLRSIGGGDAPAADRLLPLLYDELRRMARAKSGRARQGARTRATATWPASWPRRNDGSAH